MFFKINLLDFSVIFQVGCSRHDSFIVRFVVIFIIFDFWVLQRCSLQHLLLDDLHLIVADWVYCSDNVPVYSSLAWRLGQGTIVYPSWIHIYNRSHDLTKVDGINYWVSMIIKLHRFKELLECLILCLTYRCVIVFNWKQDCNTGMSNCGSRISLINL